MDYLEITTRHGQERYAVVENPPAVALEDRERVKHVRLPDGVWGLNTLDTIVGIWKSGGFQSANVPTATPKGRPIAPMDEMFEDAFHRFGRNWPHPNCKREST